MPTVSPRWNSCVGGLVVQGEGLGVELNIPLRSLTLRTASLMMVRVFNPKKSILSKSRVFGHRVVELRAHHVAVLGRSHGDELGDVVGGDDDPASVDAGVAHGAFDHAGLLEHLRLQPMAVVDGFDGVDLIEPFLAAQLVFEGLVVQLEQLGQGDVGHLLGQPVGIAQRQFHDPGRVPDGALGGHGAVGDDLRDLIGAVFVDDVVDDPAPALVVKVDVDVRE